MILEALLLFAGGGPIYLINVEAFASFVESSIITYFPLVPCDVFAGALLAYTFVIVLPLTEKSDIDSFELLISLSYSTAAAEVF